MESPRVRPKPSLLFYCQHSVGLGHLVRSLALCGALSERFQVTLFCGGRLPRGFRAPADVDIVVLPGIGMRPDGSLVSHSRGETLERAFQARSALLVDTLRMRRPAAIVVELFPFGRKKFAAEIVPFLEEARTAKPRPLVACSLRDILVQRGDAAARHDERASRFANRYFDAVLVHSDPMFMRLEESFLPSSPLTIPVHYTGFVVSQPRGTADAPVKRERRLVVSAGGGLVGGELLRTAADAHRLLWPTIGLPMKIIAGPLLPAKEWAALKSATQGLEGLELRRSVPSIATELRGASTSVSQCGYNTAMDILLTGTPALVVPYGDGHEDEQATRASRLETLGAARVLAPRDLSPETLTQAIRELVTFEPRRPTLDLNGARAATSFLVEALEGAPSSAGPRGR